MQKKPNTNETNKITRSKSKAKRDNSKGKGSKPVSNDPNWYSVDSTLLNDAARIPFSYPTGLPIGTAANNHANVGGDTVIPGIMSLHVVPTIGWSENDADPVNIAATQLYAFVRHCNSGSVNYDSGDLMLYLLAMADVYSALEYLRRAYGVAQLYSQTNRYLPKSLLRMMGVNPETVIDNLANFRYKFNILVNKAASFAVPATMSIFPRRAFLYQGIYTEGSSPKDQLYMYVPDGFYIYDWQGSRLEYLKLTPNEIKTVTGISTGSDDDGFDIMKLLEVVNYMIDVIIANEDMGTMNGDIIKAYGDNTIKLSHLSEEYFVAPAFDAYVLEQMQNATVINGGVVAHDDIHSDYVTDGEGKKTGTSIIRHKPRVTYPSVDNTMQESAMMDFRDACIVMRAAGKQILVTNLPAPEPKDIMEISRMTAVLEFDSVEGHSFKLRTGSEYVNKLSVMLRPYSYQGTAHTILYAHTGNMCHFNDYLSVQGYTDLSSLSEHLAASTVLQAADDVECEIHGLSAFKYAPIMFCYAIKRVRTMLPTTLTPNSVNVFDLSHDVNAAQIIGDVSNFALPTVWDITKLHQTALLNEFATPHVSIKPRSN